MYNILNLSKHHRVFALIQVIPRVNVILDRSSPPDLTRVGLRPQLTTPGKYGLCGHGEFLDSRILYETYFRSALYLVGFCCERVHLQACICLNPVCMHVYMHVVYMSPNKAHHLSKSKCRDPLAPLLASSLLPP